jgi:hypothetical protein
MAEVTESQLVGYLLSRGLCDISATDRRPTRARELSSSSSSKSIEKKQEGYQYTADLQAQKYNQARFQKFVTLAFPTGDQEAVRQWLRTYHGADKAKVEYAMQRVIDEKPPQPIKYFGGVLSKATGPEVLEWMNAGEPCTKRAPRPSNRQEPQEKGPGDLIAAQKATDRWNRKQQKAREDAADEQRRKQLDNQIQDIARRKP